MRETKGSASTGGATARKKASASTARSRPASGVAVPNSTAKKKQEILEPYHNIATALFNLKSVEECERDFVCAARDGDSARVELLLQRIQEIVFSIDARDSETGNTAVIWATKRGHHKIVQLLLENGADVTARNFEGQTAVEVASPQIRRLLLESCDSGGARRNLLQASWQGDAQLVKKILTEARVDVNCRNADSLTPLLLVTRDVQLFERLGERVVDGYCPADVLTDLISFRADLNAQDEEGRTALHYVSSSKASRSCELADMLLNTQGCDLDVRDRRCFTPIHCASQSGNTEVVIALLDGGCCPDSRGFAGTTPLHISAINGHDQIANALLQYGADVTLVDDGGLTAVDVAKTKKVKSTLKHAWTEATQVKSQKSAKETKCGGEVIFDSLPTASVSSIDSSSPRKQSSLLHLSNAEKARRAENQTAEGKYNAPYASTVKGSARISSRSPPAVRRLSPIRSPRKTPASSSRKELKFGPGTKLHDGTTSRHHTPLQKSPSDPCRPTSQGNIPAREPTQIPVTILGLDLDDNLQAVKLKRITPGPSGQPMPFRRGHVRHHSDPFAPSPSPSDLLIGDDFYHKGRSASKGSLVSTSDEFEDQPLSSSPPSRLNPLRTPSANDRGRLKIPGTIQEGKMAAKKPGLDLDRMQLTGQNRSPVLGEHNLHMYPMSRKVLPPTPTFLTQDCYHDNGGMVGDSSGGSKDSSPRSDVSTDDDVDILQAKSIIRGGVFNIESTRVARSSNDSGLPDEKSPSDSSSKSNSVSSSVSTISSHGSPRNVNESQPGVADSSASDPRKNGRGGSVKTSGRAAKYALEKQTGVDASAKLRSAAKDNAAKSTAPSSQQNGAVVTSSGGSTVAAKGKITVHHSDLLGEGSTRVSDGGSKVEPSKQERKELLKKSETQKVLNASGEPSKSSAARSTDKASTDSSAAKATQRVSTTQGQSNPLSKSKDFSKTKPSSDNGKAPVRSVSRQSTNITPRVTARKATPAPAAKTPRVLADLKASTDSKPSANASAVSKPMRPPSPAPKPVKAGASDVVKKAAPPRPPSPQVVPNTNTSANTKTGGGAKKSPPPRPPSPSFVALSTSKGATSMQGKSTSTTVVTMSAPSNKSSTNTMNTPCNTGPGISKSNTTAVKADCAGPASKEVAKPVIPPKKSVAEPTVTPVTSLQSSNPTRNSLSRDSQNNPMRRSLSRDSKSRRPQNLPTSSSSSSGQVAMGATAAKVAPQPDAGPRSPTKKPELTPVSSGGSHDVEQSETEAKPSRERRPSVRQITVKPAVDACNFSSQDAAGKPSVAEHTGPVIYDPFESLRREQEKQQSGDDSNAKGGKVVKQKLLTLPKKCGTSSRQPSAGKKRSKSKDRKPSAVQADAKASRPKSSKTTKTKVKKKKKSDKVTTSDRADQSNVAFVSGIGWHIETDCFDKTDVKAVAIRSDDSSDSDLDTPTKVVPNYDIDDDDYIGPVDKLRSSLSNQSLRLSKDFVTPLPGQICEVQSDTDTESEDDISDIEIAEDEVVFLPQEGDTPRVVSQTAKAINEFSRSVTQDELDQMLGKGNRKSARQTASESTAHKPSKASFTSTTHVVKMTNAQRPVQDSARQSVQMTPVQKLRKSNSTNSIRQDSDTKEESEDKRNNNSSKKSNQKPTPRAKLQTSRSRGGVCVSEGEEAEIDTMIDEIMKMTPNPSMTQSWRSLSKDKDKVKDKDRKSSQRSMTREDFENELRKSQGGEKTFRQVPNQFTPVTGVVPSPANPTPDSAGDSATLTDSFWSPVDSPVERVSPDSELENKQIEMIVNTYKNMELQINVTPGSVGSVTGKPPRGRAPPAPRASISPTDKRSSVQPEKSPRFVRKHDSFKEVRVHESQIGQDEIDVPNYGSFCSELDPLSLPSMTDSLVPEDRAEVVTSRLGRHSAVGRRDSAVTMTSAATDDDVIQWKRGNMLGKGAYGTVWCGLTNSGELIAVKQIILNTNDMERAELEYEKIQEEVELLKHLKHQNIVGYLGTSLEESTVSIFMQFVPGGSIANLLARFGALEEETFCHFTRQILEGVEYLHANNVIHRDIKGGNIMLMPNSVIKLIDFGCAKKLCLNMSSRGLNCSNSRLLKSMRGTPYWMAPEVVREEGHGTKSDIWSIGCSVFEMATKKPPWAEMQPMSAIFVIGNNTKPVPQLPEKFSQDARDFAADCMTRDPNKRPSATELLHHTFIVTRKKKSGSMVI